MRTVIARLLLAVYSLVMAALLVLTSPWWLWQMAHTGKYREGLAERLGRVPARLAAARASQAAAGRPGVPMDPQSITIWVHAVSVGEVLAASRLVAELDRNLNRARGPAFPAGRVYVSTTTRTGQTLARERFGADRVFYFPLDFAFAVRAWLCFLQPTLVVLVESELWPRMLRECAWAGVPVAVVNARISDRSWPRYQLLRRLWAPLLSSLSLVLAQSDQDALRLRRLGAAGAIASGNLKYDVRVTAEAPATALLRARVPAGARVVVCGSTLAGEEALLLDALPLTELVTVLAPRHPERFDAIARLLTERGLPWVRRSAWPADQPTGSACELGGVVLLDSVGELASVYSLATLAVVGGGFLAEGGHNPLEPAQFGVPVLMGAHYANFRAVVEALLEARAVVTADAASLKPVIERLLANPEELRGLGARAQQVFAEQAGATGRAVDALLPLLRTTLPPVGTLRAGGEERVPQ